MSVKNSLNDDDVNGGELQKTNYWAGGDL